MKLTPNSTARRSTARATSRSAGSPQMPFPVIRMAPKPSRLTVRSPPTSMVPAPPAPTEVLSLIDRSPFVSFLTGTLRGERPRRCRGGAGRTVGHQTVGQEPSHLAVEGVVRTGGPPDEPDGPGRRRRGEGPGGESRARPGLEGHGARRQQRHPEPGG